MDIIQLIDSGFKIENLFNYPVPENSIICLYSKEKDICITNKDGLISITRKLLKEDEETISYENRYKEYSIYIGSYRSDIEKELKKLKISILFSDLLVLSLSGILGYLVSGRFLKPIKKRIDKLNQTMQIISHDLRTTLSIIDTNIYILKLKGECQSGKLSNIERSISYMKNLIKNIDYLTEKMPTKREDVNINRLIREILEKYSSLISQKELKVNITENENLILNGDYTDFEVLFTNLIDNAIKYNQIKGSIEIQIEKNKISIKNTGHPIKDKKKIFEKYYREENFGTIEGIGLGLSIVRNICKTYNMSITVKTENNYNEFTISKSGGL